jgi:hypothetical protein
VQSGGAHDAVHVAVHDADDGQLGGDHGLRGVEGGFGDLFEAERGIEALEGDAEAADGVAFVVGVLEALAAADVEGKLAGGGAHDEALGFGPRFGGRAVDAEHAGRAAFDALGVAVERARVGHRDRHRRADAAGGVVVGQAGELVVHRGDGDFGQVAHHAAGQAEAGGVRAGREIGARRRDAAQHEAVGAAPEHGGRGEAEAVAQHFELKGEGLGEEVEGRAPHGRAVVGARQRADRGGLGGEQAEVALAGFDVALVGAGDAGGFDLLAVDLAAGKGAQADHRGAEQHDVDRERHEALAAGHGEADFEHGRGAGGKSDDRAGAGGGDPGEQRGGEHVEVRRVHPAGADGDPDGDDPEDRAFVQGEEAGAGAFAQAAADVPGGGGGDEGGDERREPARFVARLESTADDRRAAEGRHAEDRPRSERGEQPLVGCVSGLHRWDAPSGGCSNW